MRLVDCLRGRRRRLDVSGLRALDLRVKAAERVARDQQTRLQTIVDQAPMSVLLADCDGRYVVANRASAEQIGRPVEEIVGHVPAELYEPSIALKIERDTRRIREGAGPTTFEVTRTDARASP